jgi:hypothetical protein
MIAPPHAKACITAYALFAKKKKFIPPERFILNPRGGHTY